MTLGNYIKYDDLFLNDFFPRRGKISIALFDLLSDIVRRTLIYSIIYALWAKQCLEDRWLLKFMPYGQSLI
jgi:hypothetical protein